MRLRLVARLPWAAVVLIAWLGCAPTVNAQAEERVRGWIPLFENATSNPALAIDARQRYERHQAMIVEGRRFDRSIDGSPPPPETRIRRSDVPAAEERGWLGVVAIAFFAVSTILWIVFRFRRG